MSVHTSTLMDGRLFVYQQEKKLIAFQTSPYSKKCLILLSGMTEGPMSLHYTDGLVHSLQPHGWSVIMPVLSSSWNAYGTSSLHSDAQELSELLKYINKHYDINEILLMGHSTGAQIVTWFTAYEYEKENSELKNLVKLRGVILQAPASDRQYLESVMGDIEMQKWCQIAKERMGQDKIDNKQHGWMPRESYSFPITPYRFLSLTVKGGDDDLFTPTIKKGTKKEIQSIHSISKLIRIPIAVYISEKDQYIPIPTCIDDYVTYFEKWPSVNHIKVIPESLHGLNNMNKFQLKESLFIDLTEWILQSTI